jgi:hypothetical protein
MKTLRTITLNNILILQNVVENMMKLLLYLRTPRRRRIRGVFVNPYVILNLALDGEE